MIRIKNNLIEVCGFKVTAVRTVNMKNSQEPRVVTRIRYCNTSEEADRLKTQLENASSVVTIEEIDISKELFLDGVPCSSIEFANKWLEAGEVLPTTEETLQSQLDDLSVAMAAILGGVV